MNGTPTPKKHTIPLWVAIVTAVGTLLGTVVTAYATLAGAARTATAKEAPAAIASALRQPGLPVGTVVAYFGDPNALGSSSGWVLCDGRTVAGGKLAVDANAAIGDIQIPDLRGKFVRGVEAFQPLIVAGGIASGGKDDIKSEGHAHVWATFSNKNWFTYGKNDSSLVAVTKWKDGMGSPDTGNFPLSLTGGSQQFFTSPSSHNHGGDNRPRFVALHYICRVE